MKTEYVSNFQSGASEPEPRQECAVVLAYDELPAGRQAMELVSWMSSKHGDVRFDIRAWRFDLLDHPDFERSATWDGVTADVLVLSASNPFDVPNGVRTWLTQCLAGREGSAAAVVALLGPKNSPRVADSPLMRFAQTAAKTAGFDFFSPLAKQARLARRGAARAGSADDWLPGNGVPAREFSGGDPIRGWGTND
jgi:hypothetical protein